MNKDVINIKPDELIKIVQSETEKGESVLITVVGNSMYPFLRNGIDSVELFSADSIKKNDVLFYVRDNGQCILHRCIKIKNGEYVMCGDNQTNLEYGINHSSIIAKAKVFHRNGKQITEDTKWYKLYKFLWCTLFPMRRVMCAALKAVMKIKRVLKRSR